MKVKIVEDRCIGCGQCEFTCDKVFKVEDDGIAHVLVDEVEENCVEDVELAMEGCPTDAIEKAAYEMHPLG